MNGVECCALLGESLSDEGSRLRGGETRGVGAICRVPHQAIENCPGWAKDVGRWAVGWLLKSQIGLLVFVCWGAVSIVLQTGDGT